MSYIHHLENQLEDESQGQEIVTPPEESRRKTDNNDDTVSNDSNSSDRLDSSPKVNNKRASLILGGKLWARNTEMQLSSGVSCLGHYYIIALHLIAVLST